MNAISHKDVADYFLAFANSTGDLVTNLRLQKLVYYAQAWYLANYNTPLFDADFEAWVHGPVVPDLYHEYKHFGSIPIVSALALEEVANRFDVDTGDFLKEVAEVYMPYTAYHLEFMTYIEFPWVDARRSLPTDAACNNIISKEAMRAYYAQRLKEN